jgi:hypothetical protein
MRHFRNILKLFQSDKGMTLVMLLVSVLAIGMMITLVYHIVDRPRRVATMPKGLNELIRQLDKTIESVKAKAKIVPLNFAITKEAEAEDKDVFILNGVLWSGGDSLAIINKKIVGIADRVGDCWITDIQENSVTIRCRSGEEKVLRCF